MEMPMVAEGDRKLAKGAHERKRCIAALVHLTGLTAKMLAGAVLLACSGGSPGAGPVSTPPPRPTETAAPIVTAAPGQSVTAAPTQPPPAPIKVQPTVLATGLTLRNRVALTADGGNVYFGSSGDKKLMKVPVSGGTPVTLAPADDIRGIAVDAANVYWADGKIMKVAIGGGTPVKLASDSGIGSVAVDATSVYWTSWNGKQATLKKVPIGGGKVSTLSTGSAFPEGLVVDASAVYWTSWSGDSSVSSSTEGDGTVLKAPLGGGTPVALASRLPSPHFLAIDATNLYWNNTGPRQAPSLMKVPVAGGPVTTLATQVYTSAVAVDGKRVFWSDYNAGAILAVGIDGGSPTVLADGQAKPNTLVAHAGSIYWANLGTGSGDGSILKLSPP